MKTSFLALASCLAALVSTTPCPFAEMHKNGLLSSEDAAKFMAVKRDPGAAEGFLEEYRQKHRRGAEEHNERIKRQTSLPPLLGGLPLGGGLRKQPNCEHITPKQLI